MDRKTPTIIPDPLRGVEIGSFAHSTITIRLPAIGKRILEENDFPLPIQVRLENLFSELPSGLIRPLDDPEAPDLAGWNGFVGSYLGQNWLQIPWFMTETYFYRRVLEATGYFQQGPGSGHDPYTYQKRQGLEAFHATIQAACASLMQDLVNRSASTWEMLAEWVFINLWGNQVDLSMWPAGHARLPEHSVEAQRQHLLSDHTLSAIAYLSGAQFTTRHIDIILDNAGMELVYDLLLAVLLLERGVVHSICLHAKSHPTFVSDAMVKDVYNTLSYLADSTDTGLQSVGQKLRDLMAGGSLLVRDHFFWTSPLAAWDMPEGLRQEFMQSSLMISKGDANYRRFLGDRHWAFDTPVEAALAYLPAPWLGLRVSKSQVMVGLQPGQAEKLDALKPGWLTNGRWGLIQFHNPRVGR